MNEDPNRGALADRLREIAPAVPSSLMPRVIGTVEANPPSRRGRLAAVGVGTFAVLAGGALGIVLLGSHTRPSSHRTPGPSRPVFRPWSPGRQTSPPTTWPRRS